MNDPASLQVVPAEFHGHEGQQDRYYGEEERGCEESTSEGIRHQFDTSGDVLGEGGEDAVRGERYYHRTDEQLVQFAGWQPQYEQ